MEIFALLWICDIKDQNLRVKCKLYHCIIVKYEVRDVSNFCLCSFFFPFVSGKPRKRKKMERIGSFLRSVWKAVKRPFGGCCDSSAVDVVEPFVPPADSDSDSDPDPDPDPDPSSPDPDHSGVKPNNGKSAVIIILEHCFKQYYRLVFPLKIS